MGKFIEDVGLAGVSAGFGLLNTGLQAFFNHQDKEDEKQWWYEQQKYLEEHNSPAYRAMQMRKAGLNPYSETSSTPLGNVDSSLPRMNAPHTFDVNAIQNSLLVNAQRENLEEDTNKKASETGLNMEKTKTESEWRSNIIQQTLNLKQAFDMGLITKEESELKLNELKYAYSLGYNSYLIDQDLKESDKLLNNALASLYGKEGKKVDKETELLAVRHASESFELILDKLYSALEREAGLKHVEINNSFTQTEYEEFLDTQEVRQSLLNVQKAFAKLAVDEAERQDALSQINNEKDKQVAQQMLDAVENGEGLRYWILQMLQRDPSAFLSSMSNIISSMAPNVSYNRSSSTVIRQNAK